MDLRRFRAILNAADPAEPFPRARVAKARNHLERVLGREIRSKEDTKNAEKRLARAELRLREIIEARTRARLLIEDSPSEIAALFGKPAADLAAYVEAQARGALTTNPEADEAEIWRVILASLLASADARIEAARPERPSLVAVLAAEATFRADPRPETLRALARVAVENGEAKSIGAPWDRIGKLIDLAPRVGVEVDIHPYEIRILWGVRRPCRYRFAYAPDAIADAARLVGPAMTSAG